MSEARKIFFELIPSPAGEIEAVRVPIARPEYQLCALISRLGAAEASLVDDESFVFCRERFAGRFAGRRTEIPHGIRLFFFATDHV